ncbi:hypothetical protein [Aquimarina sp. AU474]|uniref:hypothetical protein n=1 Tax=Aquimarina sp. AU474 TaxID=2108529 RepID=UPI000D69AF72|nr:hypothetical protein [Aquimarina sp. AU474]
MKSKKKLILKKMNISQLGSVKGGNPNGGFMQTANPDGCGLNSNLTTCLYSQNVMSCQICVAM